jgi:uncharacterized membrane protein YphA (DoxX/SURF4 family)
MPPRRLVCAFVALWWTLGLVLLWLSVRTVIQAAGSGVSHEDLHAVILGSIEAIAAVLFLIPPTMRVGGIGLLLTFAIAFLVHTTRGQFAAPLLIYAAGVLFVIVHGPVSVRALRTETPASS